MQDDNQLILTYSIANHLRNAAVFMLLVAIVLVA